MYNVIVMMVYYVYGAVLAGDTNHLVIGRLSVITVVGELEASSASSASHGGSDEGISKGTIFYIHHTLCHRP